MTLTQLKVFIAVAERQHMTQASYDLGMAQSAVSAMIASLETNLGCPLFARIGRGIALTPSGRFFFGEANAILDRVAAARRGVKMLGLISCTPASEPLPNGFRPNTGGEDDESQ